MKQDIEVNLREKLINIGFREIGYKKIDTILMYYQLNMYEENIIYYSRTFKIFTIIFDTNKGKKKKRYSAVLHIDSVENLKRFIKILEG